MLWLPRRTAMFDRFRRSGPSPSRFFTIRRLTIGSLFMFALVPVLGDRPDLRYEEDQKKKFLRRIRNSSEDSGHSGPV